MEAKKSLGPLEHKVMSIVWKQKEATVYSVIQGLGTEKKLAYTTVMTVMSRLAKQGILSRHKRGKTFVYRPRESKEMFIQSLVRNTINRFIERFGDEAVTAFLDQSSQLSKEDRKKLISRLDSDD